MTPAKVLDEIDVFMERAENPGVKNKNGLRNLVSWSLGLLEEVGCVIAELQDKLEKTEGLLTGALQVSQSLRDEKAMLEFRLQNLGTEHKYVREMLNKSEASLQEAYRQIDALEIKKAMLDRQARLGEPNYPQGPLNPGFPKL